MKCFERMLVIALLWVFGAVGTFAQSGSAWVNEDASNPFLVKYLGDQSYSITTVVSATSFHIGSSSDSAIGSTIALSPAKTVADLVGAIEAYTNVSGQYIFDAMVWEAISSDTVSNKLLAANVTLKNADWVTDFKWDTSLAKHYSLVPDIPAGNDQAFGGYRILDILGEPGGTGNLTVRIYEENTLKYIKTIVSPHYPNAYLTNTTSAVFDLQEWIDLGNGVWIPSTKKGMIRATRATTGTTGGIGGNTTKLK